ncbi:DUF6265 family protein [Microbulbifer taiwanensis]|uniref:DUF6265 family protein n=1 Tax=Microbulbifer taiwanensis TaxID=986746 RepID=A0ABW1YRM5_9GAMM|nr:DUF6265 family protein [Microbulbifer taiwanensis]
MKYVFGLFGVLLFLSAPISVASECKTMESLRWLNGNWLHEDSEKKVSEEWGVVKSLYKDGILALEGKGEFYSKKDDSKSGESLRIIEMSGEIFYLAKISENKFPVPFKLIDCSKNGAVFGNDEHDFPNLIRYTLSEIGILDVYVGDNDGNGFMLQFHSQERL